MILGTIYLAHVNHKSLNAVLGTLLLLASIWIGWGKS